MLSSQYALMIEYRAEIVLWAVSGILPLIMLALWSGSNSLESLDLNKQDITRYFMTIEEA